MRLDVDAAASAIDEVARAIRQSTLATAQAILTIASEHMVQAIREITINVGVDPRESLIVAGGGAAGLNIAPIARELGCSRVLLPRTAGAFSAAGAQLADVLVEFSRSQFAYTGDFPYESVNVSLSEITASMRRFARGFEKRGLSATSMEYFVEAHYPYQVWELEVPVAKERFEDSRDVQGLIEAFHQAHERVFAVKEPGQQIECLYWKGRLTVRLPRPRFRKSPMTTRTPKPRKTRGVHFRETGEFETPIYIGEELKAGMSIIGPAIVQEPTTTVVLHPKSALRVTPLHSYLMELG
jgi:N-methylhydantoinase A